MAKLKFTDRWTLGYFLLKYLWIKNTVDLYYRKREKRNAGVINLDRPLILAPNHQNALMDAMALVTQIPYQTIFMTRADIFSKPAVMKMLMWLKMLPIYRIRDGVESLGKNEEIFEETTRILKNHHNPLCLFPEGNHGDRRRLRPLVKGIFRIAFKAQEDYKDQPGVRIIPVGIDYGHYQKFRQTLFLNFGQPIEVSDYWELYSKNQASGMNALRNRLISEMRKCMIDIQSEEYYETYMGLREFYRPEMFRKLGLKKKSLANKFDADKVLISALDDKLKEHPDIIKVLDSKFKRYANLRDKMSFRDWVFRKKRYSHIVNILLVLLFIILSPIFAAGLIVNWPHYYIPQKISRKIKDTQFRSTASWGSGTVIQAIYYLLLAIPALVFLPRWWMAFVALILFPISGLAALSIRNLFVKTMARIRYNSGRKWIPEIKEALTLREEVLELLSRII